MAERVRQWEFWRKGFWTRPVLMMMYTVVVALLGLVHEVDLVTIDLGDGTRVTTRAGGVRGAMFFAAMSLLCLAGALMVFSSGWAMGRRLGWLSTRLADRDEIESCLGGVRRGVRPLRPAPACRPAALLQRRCG